MRAKAAMVSATAAALVCWTAAEAQAQGTLRQFWPFQQRPQSERSRPSRVTREREQPAAPSSSRSQQPAARAASAGSQRSAGSSVITKPTVITRPGRYVLSENVAGVADATTAAIVITAPDVTLDLNGYLIRGRESASPDNCGVAVLADRARVRNGSIEEFSGENQCGVLVGAGVKDFALEDLRIGNCETGVLINPENDPEHPVLSGRLDRCTVTSGSIGILAFPSVGVTLDSCTVSGCIPRRPLEGEGSGAVLRGVGYVVRECSFTSCTDGLRLEADGALLLETVCAANRETGSIVGGEGTLVRDSTFSANGGDGLVLTESTVLVESCAAAGNGGQQISRPAAPAATPPAENAAR